MASNYINGASSEVPSFVAVDPIEPYNILAITFTNKAANELKSRIVNKIGPRGNDVYAGTFHSVCSKILRIDGYAIGYTSHYTIYDTDDQKKLMKEIYKDFDIDEKMLPSKSVLNEISRSKDSLITPEEYEKTAGYDQRKKMISEIYKAYNARLKNADAMDFDDLIVNTVRLFETAPDILEKYRNKFKYIMVDEYQDTNHAQYVFVSMLAKNTVIYASSVMTIRAFTISGAQP